MADEISQATTALLTSMRRTDTSAPELSLDAATPLDTLPPDLVALVVGRVQAGATAFGDDHPRATVTRRIVVPSLVLVVLDAVGLGAAAATGHEILAAVAAVLLVLLAYLAFAGVRFVRQDPLRVTTEQRDRVEAAKRWRSSQPWTHEQRGGPWGRLVAATCVATGHIAASDAWTWASTSSSRAQTQLGATLDAVDAAAFRLASDGTPTPDHLDASTRGAGLVHRVAALQCCVDCLDDLVLRASHDDRIRTELPAVDDQRVSTFLAGAAGRGTPDGEPS